MFKICNLGRNEEMYLNNDIDYLKYKKNKVIIYIHGIT